MKKIASLLAPIALAACSAEVTVPQADQAQMEKDLHTHIAKLASDEFEGRFPASKGEKLTIAYLKEQLESSGVEPGNNGDWFQQVPVVSITATPASAKLAFEGKGYTADLAYGSEMVVGSHRQQKQVEFKDSELVFVGYGINAPERNWNDYEGIDMKGKTAVILINDPGYATQDENVFNGNSMTYYGRWTYKYEEAARQGADGAIIVHDTAPASYPWAVVQNSWSGPQIYMQSKDGGMSRNKAEAWIQLDQAKALFKAAGLDFETEAKKASEGGYKPKSLGINASASFNNIISKSKSNNVVGMVKGSEKPDEYIVIMAHWDHLGRDFSRKDDQIFNGAMDNASGTAGLLTLAREIAQSKIKPKRSVVFVAVTAEEQGLIGSKYYAANPVFPLEKTVALINMDSMAVFGETHDVQVIGYGGNELEDILKKYAEKQGRYIVPEPTPERGYYFRSDHFSLAKFGVPGLYAKSGIEHREKGKEYILAAAKEYTAKRYHKPADEYDPNWDLGGAAEDLQLYFQMTMDLALSDEWPNWRAGSEFKAARDAAMAKR